MSETKWTNEQWEAITTKDCNLLVAAAAGAGKTAVLVERIIRKITDADYPIDIDRLLIVTFTNAAAAEMRERIRDAIASVLEKNPQSPAIQRQLTLLNKASITTIHSFCLDVIRNNFQRIDIDPNFRISDETEANLLKLEVLQELFEDLYVDGEERQDFYELLESYGGNRDDQALQSMVLNLFSFIQSSPFPKKWLHDMTEILTIKKGQDFSTTPWGKILLKTAVLELEDLREMMTRAVDILQGADGLDKYLPVFSDELANLEGLLKRCHAESDTLWDSLYHALQAFDFGKLPNAKKDCDTVKKETVQQIRKEVKARLSKLKDRIVNAQNSTIKQDLNRLYPLMKCLADLVREFSDRYAARKSKKALVDFNDLEHFALDILTEVDEQGNLNPSTVASGYRERFAEILVDEYQDSNLVQEMMIRMISREQTAKPNVFMVGDVKQSIYRFRQAKPELFLEKYLSYPLEKGGPSRKVLLFKNFRSRKEVVDAVNFIFKQIMSVEVGELDYTDTEALNPGAIFEDNTLEDTFVGGEVELHLIQTGGKEEASSSGDSEEEYGESMGKGEANQREDEAEANGGIDLGRAPFDDQEILDNIQCEARLVAQRITELLQPNASGQTFQVYDKARKAYRKVEFRDIVILLRATKNWSDVFVEELALRGIPAFADTGSGFFKTPEIQIILSLLQIIDNPLQDIPLLAVLRSPIVAFTTDELAELRLADRKAPLFEALRRLAGEELETYVEHQGVVDQIAECCAVESQSALRKSASSKAAAFLNNLKRWRDMSLYLSTDQLIWKLYNELGFYGMVGAMPNGLQRQANLRVLFERARQFEETSFKGLFNFINFVDKLKSSRGDMGSAKILGENDNVVRIMSIHKSKGLEFPVVILSGCGKKFNLLDMNKTILLHQELGFGPDVVDHRRRISYPSIAKQAIREKVKVETLSEEMRILYVALTRAREKLIITGAVSDISKVALKWVRTAEVDADKLSPSTMLNSDCYLGWIGPALMRHPQGKLLRECGQTNEEVLSLLKDSSTWSIKLWGKEDVTNSQNQVSEEEEEFIQWLEDLTGNKTRSEIASEVERRLSWEYPYAKLSQVPAKVSVTELKRRFDTQVARDGDGSPTAPSYLQPTLIKKPMFLTEKKGLSAAELGTVMHFVMQHLDYKNPDLKGQVEEMVAKDLLTDQQVKGIEIDKIESFLTSPLGKRMLKAQKVYREVPFNMEIPCSEVYEELGEEAQETVLLQGVIDCYFEESEGIVLIDYKTDYVPEGKSESLRDKFKLQISYYSRVLEMLTGKKVKDKYIYLFGNGEVLEY